MSKWLWLLRFLSLASLALVLGGFTLYGGVVLPILHDEFGISASVAVTRRVTDALNLMCGVTAVFWWTLLWFEANLGSRAWRLLRAAALATTTVTALALVLLHVVMERRLGTGAMDGFDKLHRAYLLLSTVQWAANLGILAASARLWGGGTGRDGGGGETAGAVRRLAGESRLRDAIP